jgi:hypothetical protein
VRIDKTSVATDELGKPVATAIYKGIGALVIGIAWYSGGNGGKPVWRKPP